MRPFTRFACADWSGAKGSRHPGIALAVCEAGSEAPRLVPAPSGIWSRQAVADWLLAHLPDEERADSHDHLIERRAAA
ncbi:MAG: hypothetical protein B7Y01_04515 [Xanthobacter sp. 17-67-6]|nr:MAG: hypothetical protein B7Y01_04515 [Xanthobacter sp. 17-67-6]